MTHLNAIPFVRAVAGSHFVDPEGGWNVEFFKAYGGSLAVSLHRVSSVVRMDKGADIARDAYAVIRRNVEDVIDQATGRKMKLDWSDYVAKARAMADKEIKKVMLPHIQSVMSQGYSKTNVILRQKDSRAVLRDIAKAAQAQVEEIEEVNATTGRQIVRVVSDGISEGMTLSEIAIEVASVVLANAKSRARTIGRSESTKAWNKGSVDAMQASKKITHYSVIGCISRETELWEKPYYQAYMFDADGRDKESSCRIKDVPAKFMGYLNFHPNHTGTIVPSRWSRKA